MNEGIFNFQFNGVNIPFKANLGNTFIMINATEMAKSVCKTKEEYLRLRPAMWIRSKDCKDYLNAIVNVRKVHIEDLIITSKGGSKFGPLFFFFFFLHSKKTSVYKPLKPLYM